jgi:hypothetical protein
MEQHIYYLLFAVLLAAFIPFVPILVKARIWLARKIRLIWLADIVERNFDRWVTGIRILMACMAVLLLIQWIRVS